MNIDNMLKEIGSLQYSQQVDVVAPVMEKVKQHPYLQPAAKRNWRIPMMAAAAVVLLLLIAVPFARTGSYNEELIGNTLSQVNDYSNYPCYNTIEESAVAELAPLDYLYNEEIQY